MTIAFAIETDEELLALESKHVCPEKALADLLAYEKLIHTEPAHGSSQLLN
jgi:hypothetical protein